MTHLRDEVESQKKPERCHYLEFKDDTATHCNTLQHTATHCNTLAVCCSMPLNCLNVVITFYSECRHYILNWAMCSTTPLWCAGGRAVSLSQVGASFMSWMSSSYSALNDVQYDLDCMQGDVQFDLNKLGFHALLHVVNTFYIERCAIRHVYFISCITSKHRMHDMHLVHRIHTNDMHNIQTHSTHYKHTA